MGPLAPEVYWRRRLAILGALVIAFVGLRACASGDAPRAGAQPARTPTASATADGTAERPFRPVLGKASPTPIPAASARPVASALPATGPCTDAELLLTASTGARQYPLGSAPKLILTVRNVSARTCARDLGAGARELIITSGPAHTWSSADCQPVAGRSQVMLKPGAVQTFTQSWAGRRSQPKCGGSQPAATAGTYRVRARLGTLRSDTWLFRLI